MSDDIKTKVDRLWKNICSIGTKNTAEALVVISALVLLHRSKKQEFTSICSDTRLETVSRFFRDRAMENGFLPMKDDSIEVIWRVMNSYQFLVVCEDIHYIDDSAYNDMEEGREICRYLLRIATSSGYLGQYSTPDYIARLMVRLMPPEENDIICDPSCGAGALLSAVWDFMCEKYGNPSSKQLFGYDIDESMIALAAENLRIHNAKEINLACADALSGAAPTGLYNKIYINPPYNINIPKEQIVPELLDTYKSKKSELLFIALTLQLLREEGQCACIIPNSFLYSIKLSDIAIRKTLVDNHNLQAVISLPRRAFLPYTNIETSILLFTKSKKNHTKSVWFYNMLAPSDYNDVVKRYHQLEQENERTREQQSFLVSIAELQQYKYNLSQKTYSEQVLCAESYPAVDEVLAELCQLEGEIAHKLSALRESL